MALLIFDRVQETSTTTGTGPFTLAGAKLGFETFAQNFAVNDTTYYTIQNTVTGEWEVGVGTYSAANTLTRTTVLHSSNANTAVSFGAGTKDVFVTAAAAMLPPNPVRTVNGTAPDAAGNVTVAAGGTTNTAVTRTAPTASASTALTTIQSYPTTAGEVVAGSEYNFYASLRLVNTTAASNLVITIAVGATNVLVLTQAVGTAQALAPGKAVTIEGRITFYSATQAECVIRTFASNATIFDTIANTSAPITVSAAGATTINLQVNTSATTSTFIARQATIQRVK